MAGLPWRNMFIGGFFAGEIGQAWYEELYIRWFQYATFEFYQDAGDGDA